jgi:hypothetical protein
LYLLLLAGAAVLARGADAQQKSPGLVVSPSEITLEGNFARGQLVVTRPDADGKLSARSDDLTGQVRFASSDPSVVAVSAAGELTSVRNGQATIVVTRGDERCEVSVAVLGVAQDPSVSFNQQIRPILNKAGCAMAACHAAQHGKGGFKLSVFGFEPDKDRQAMVRDALQRRADFVQPERSLLLLKPTMQVPHGGGKRLEKGSVDYEIMRAWIAAGGSGPAKNEAEVVKLHVFPARRVGQAGMSQQLRVEAEYADGKRRDVTAWAKYDSLDDGVISVAPSGRVATVGKGQAAVMIRFDGQAEISLFVVPYADKIALAGWQSNNFMDELAAAKFRELGIEPSPLCDDATFVRRAFLDAIGNLH